MMGENTLFFHAHTHKKQKTIRQNNMQFKSDEMSLNEALQTHMSTGTYVIGTSDELLCQQRR